MATDAEQLRGRGVDITLRDGSTATLHYDFDALAALEDRYGSVPAAMLELSTILPPRLEDGSPDMEAVTPLYRPMRELLHAALMHTGEADALVRRLDPLRIHDYVRAVFKAVDQDMPRAEKAGEAPAPAASNGRSPGASSTTSRRSRSAAVTSGSGA